MFYFAEPQENPRLKTEDSLVKKIKLFFKPSSEPACRFFWSQLLCNQQEPRLKHCYGLPGQKSRSFDFFLPAKLHLYSEDSKSRLLNLYKNRPFFISPPSRRENREMRKSRKSQKLYNKWAVMTINN